VSAVHEAEHSGNGAARRSQEARSLADFGRQIQYDTTHALTATVQDATAGLESYLTAQVARHPYETLGIGAGIGYVLGEGLSSRLTVALFGTATRLAMALAARELGARLLPSRPPSPAQHELPLIARQARSS
jgi:ElaB/YqjD/DUF883 family membrane-anchored ribosome-binding protein